LEKLANVPTNQVLTIKEEMPAKGKQ